jgi:predicted NAD-dependent protein-ADP-ribosyltransferase YbiA (DUF1768 family)
MTITVLREKWSDFCTVVMPNGQTEEFDIEELRKWLKDRGAEPYATEKALDYLWNFGRVGIEIQKPKTPSVNRESHFPDV